jgi:hypothetical protein
VNKIFARAAAASAALLIAGCTAHLPASGSSSSSRSQAPAPVPADSDSVSAPATLPAFPSLPADQILVEAPHVTSDKTWTTRALPSQHLAVQLACTGPRPTRDTVTVELRQRGRVAYRIQHQPCNGMIQKINLTADSKDPLEVSGSVPPSSFFALLIS